jgi:hypothetical protein
VAQLSDQMSEATRMTHFESQDDSDAALSIRRRPATQPVRSQARRGGAGPGGGGGDEGGEIWMGLEQPRTAGGRHSQGPTGRFDQSSAVGLGCGIEPVTIACAFPRNMILISQWGAS